ncbi:MAG: hypothetical protein IT271_02885 [Chitinophagales bacterium]|nr:hypothetical protein [Chitinophagales bacterium]
MKKVFIFLAVVSVIAFCTRKNNKAEIMTASNGMQYVKLIPITGDANTENGSSGAYQGYEIKDPGIRNMSAILLQIPNGWQAQNSFTRIWNGSTPVNQVYVKAVSTDNTSSVEILPYSPYFYADGPTTRSLRETSRSMGMEQKLQPFEMPPMNPLVYIKQIVLSRLQQNGISFKISNEQDLGEQNQFKGQPASRHAYVDGRTQDGRNIRVECGIQLTANNMNGEIYYNWSAFPAIITGNNLDENYAVLKHIRGTVLYNPEWEQQCNAMNRKGNAANAEIAQKDFENVKAYREAVNNIHQGVTDYRNASNDRNNESFRDVLGGEAKFENPNNGERVRLDDNYKHYYTDEKGNYYGSNDPMDYKAMGWSEVNRLDTKEY